MNYLFTICGRAGSKGLESKNLMVFAGVPLAYLTVAAIKLAAERLESEGHRVYVSCSSDSKDLLGLLSMQNCLDPLMIERAPELSGDTVAKVSVIRDCLERSEEHWGVEFDYVVDLDITSPLRTVQDVMNAIHKKASNRETDVVYSVCNSRKNPYFNQAKLVDGLFEKVIKANYVSRQETPVVYDMNASIYVYEPRSLREKEATDFFNSNADAIVMRDTGVLDIDCLEDFEMMEVLATHYFYSKSEAYSEIFEYAKRIDEEKGLVELQNDLLPMN